MDNKECEHSNTYDIRVWLAIGVFYENRTVCKDCGLVIDSEEVWCND